jgi:hypothetical protein
LLETVLGELANLNELYLGDECEDIKLDLLHGTVQVFHKKAGADWATLGGTEQQEDNQNGYFYRMFYDNVTARFVDCPYEDNVSGANEVWLSSFDL